MQAASTTGLRIAPDSCLPEPVMKPQRSLPRLLERRSLARIQIKNGLIRLREVRDLCTPGMEFDGPLVSEPDQTRCIVDQWQSHAALDRLGTILYPPYPVGSRVGTVAQVVRDAGDALREHTQRDRALFELWERHVRHLPVIMQHLAVRES